MSLPSLYSGDDEAHYRPHINTGLPLDIINGKYIPKEGGGFALSGGMGLTTAFIAEANRFKSTLLHGCGVNAMARFPGSEYHNLDSEYAASDKERLANMSNRFTEDPIQRAAHIQDLKDRIHLFDPTTEKGENLDSWIDHMKYLRDFKISQYKKFEIETELLDIRTGKPYRMLMPTFVGIDSWTEAHVNQLNIRNDEITADTDISKQRTVFMEEGVKKTQLMRQLPSICAKAGIYLCLTGHLGKKIAMGATPNKKDLTYMGADETTKGMGPKFEFLMTNIFKISNTRPIVDKSDKRLTLYPSENNIGGVELQELDVVLIRSKNVPSGAQTQLVSSQRFGIMPGLSFYNYLTNSYSKYFGMGSPNKVRNPLLGDQNLGRTKIFDLSRDYKVERALELVFQLCVIQQSWTLIDQPVDYTIPPEAFAEKLAASGYATDDILNSRGWWTYKGAPGVDRPYMTLPDILMIIEGKYKPKLFAVTQNHKKVA